MGLFFHIGRYASFMRSVLRRPEQGAVFRKLLVEEMNAIGLQSLGIVALLSVFMGAVICIQTAHQIGGWIPVYTIGFTVRQTMILEFSPTLIPVILAARWGPTSHPSWGPCGSQSRLTPWKSWVSTARVTSCSPK